MVLKRACSLLAILALTSCGAFDTEAAERGEVDVVEAERALCDPLNEKLITIANTKGREDVAELQAARGSARARARPRTMGVHTLPRGALSGGAG